METPTYFSGTTIYTHAEFRRTRNLIIGKFVLDLFSAFPGVAPDRVQSIYTNAEFSKIYHRQKKTGKNCENVIIKYMSVYIHI